LQFALDLTWNFPGDVSLLPPQPDTYIQPVQGVGGILAANKAFGGNARTLSTLSWNWAKDQSFTVVQQHTYIQDIQGLLSNERDRLARFRTAVKANTRMWETYPFLSIPPPPPIPQLLVLTATVNSFLLTWQNDPTALVYNVYRGLRSGQEALYGISLTPNFVDANVVRGITYFYRVTSVVILESDFSNEVFGMLLASTSAEVPLTGVDRERRHQEWYVCDRCGTYYPRERMLNQNGLNLCTGADTHNCWDKRGHAVNERFLDIPYEQRPEPLPWQDDEL
jgi:hypothetical protein